MRHTTHQKPYDYTRGPTHASLGDTCAAAGVTTTTLQTRTMHRSEGVRSQEVRGPSIPMQCMTKTYGEEIACRQQPGLRRGCRVHAVSSVEVVEAVRGGGAVRKILQFVSMP